MSNIDFSIICATIDPTEDVEEFLKHLTECINKVKNQISIDLILVDQFKESREKYLRKINPNIRYIHSQKKGLSLNRNLGIRLIQSNAYAFIDCDCRINASYFYNFLEMKKNHPYASMIYGKIASIENNQDIFKSWPKKQKEISMRERWLISTSVNIIYIGKTELFDESFGIGANYGSCEDIDLALRFQGIAIYTPKIKILHPLQDFSKNSNEKIFKYAVGFGALCRKHTGIYSKVMFFLSVASSFKKIILLQCSYSQFKSSLMGKLTGFLNFKR